MITKANKSLHMPNISDSNQKVPKFAENRHINIQEKRGAVQAGFVRRL